MGLKCVKTQLADKYDRLAALAKSKTRQTNWRHKASRYRAQANVLATTEAQAK